ncbi:hypothetical protein niasHT_012910 [Heterodera trifolii]|uniref:Integrase catalytic domain-containing protein n=1 Tax=Heterodera trifolii TaxID=157864 RepID=A0ABD2L698_9BILA
MDGSTKETITEQNHPDGTGNPEGISPEKMELINTTLDKIIYAKKKCRIIWMDIAPTTLMRPRRVHFPRAKTVAAGFMTDVQVDLADFQALSRHNGGHRYLLVAIDVLSKRLFVVPLKNKRAEEMLEAFKELIEQMPMVPHRIFSDKGTEFKNKLVKEFFEEQEIAKHEPVHSSVKASVAERAIRNVKQRLYRYFAEKQTLNWVDIVQQIVDGINSAPSRVHGMRPIDVNFKNAQKVDQVMKAVRPIRYKLRDERGESSGALFMSRSWHAGSWVCGLHSISYPYSWHSTIGTLDDQWIDIHFTNLHSVDEDRQRVIRVPVPQASHKKVEQLRDFLQATLKSQEKVRLKPLAHEEGYFDKPDQQLQTSLHCPRPRGMMKQMSNNSSSSSLSLPPDSMRQRKGVKKVEETPPPPAAKQAMPSAPTLAPPSHPATEAPKAVTATKQAAPKSATAPPQMPSVTSGITAAKTTPAPAPIPPTKQAPSVPKPSTSKTAAVPKPTPTPTPASKSSIPTPASSTKPQNTAKIPPPLAAKPAEPNVAKKPTVPTTVSTTSISNLTSLIEPTPTTPKPPPPPIKPIPSAIPTPSPPKSTTKDVKRSVEAPNEKKKESKRILDVDDRFFGGLAAGDEFPDDDDKESEWPYDPFKNIVDDVEIQYLEDFERFKVVLKSPLISHLSFSPQLGYVLGFENPQHVGPQEVSKYGCDLRGGFSSFAVYSKGLTENMIVGNSLSSLLRVVSVSGATPGDYNEKIYDSPIYARVLPREINEIEIELRTMDKGRLVPFAYGTTMAEAFVNEGKKGIDTVLEKGGLPKQFGSGGRKSIKRKRAHAPSHQTIIGRTISKAANKRIRSDAFGLY